MVEKQSNTKFENIYVDTSKKNWKEKKEMISHMSILFIS